MYMYVQHLYQVCQLEGHSGKVRALAASPDGTFIASGGEDCHILLWSALGNGPDMSPDIDRQEGKVTYLLACIHRLIIFSPAMSLLC